MLTGLLVFVLLFLHALQFAHSSSLLCGRTKEVEVGNNIGAGAALALTLLRPPSANSTNSTSSCQLRLAAPDAAAFTIRLIDVKLNSRGFSPEIARIVSNLEAFRLKLVRATRHEYGTQRPNQATIKIGILKLS
ncbi:jg20425 [Pararge aegeria aegeria]|uniref:Jg20425 protein n=1 Tax=Pararge aegeria aegeria TaxID=348720 RepID=A0A8S4RXT0_9NEOP|nr:jg20425 [Pararge aegeria aegeria]